MNIYLGNLDYHATEDQIKNIFEQYGEITSVKIIVDKFTKRSKGFAFVEMSNDDEAKQAIENLNGYTFNNRQITVNEARPKTENTSRENRGGYNNRNNRY